MLTVSRTADDAENGTLGQNRMECRTCPYQYLITDRLFERTMMKRKEVDDVMGGKDAWANADRTGGMYLMALKLFLQAPTLSDNVFMTSNSTKHSAI